MWHAWRSLASGTASLYTRSRSVPLRTLMEMIGTRPFFSRVASCIASATKSSRSPQTSTFCTPSAFTMLRSVSSLPCRSTKMAGRPS
ncbi:hypothetical protein STCU_10545 [Strigomonas culicis]|uniref:Uncharacterized protein n=1 Tax=Strigomonas culicis TaxID=28005 RepID=S9USK3_9TRYP|nr:hypothetical protein STCU_10545 [Strigomonas culicis]|eukprot:EPY17536.1 hypothetical protein STCU_10545 [Strigomonas culicis]